MIRMILAAALAASFALPARAQDRAEAGVVVLQPWTRATAASAPTAAGYMALRNDGSQPERLLSASSPLARAVELHETRMDGDIMRMRQLDMGLKLPPVSTVRLDLWISTQVGPPKNSAQALVSVCGISFGVGSQSAPIGTPPARYISTPLQ